MIAKPPHHIPRVREEQRHILRLDVVVLGRGPEVVPDHHAVLIRKLVKGLFRVLAHPVPDDVDVRLTMQPEEWLQVFPAHALARVVHTPVASTRRNSHAIHLDDQIGEAGLVRDRPDGWRTFARYRKRGRPVLCGLAHGCVVHIHQLIAVAIRSEQTRSGRRHLRPAQPPPVVEQAELVSDLAYAEGDAFPVGLGRTVVNGKLQVIELRLAITVRPPQPRL